MCSGIAALVPNGEVRHLSRSSSVPVILSTYPRMLPKRNNKPDHKKKQRKTEGSIVCGGDELFLVCKAKSIGEAVAVCAGSLWTSPLPPQTGLRATAYADTAFENLNFLSTIWLYMWFKDTKYSKDLISRCNACMTLDRLPVRVTDFRS